MEMHQGSLLFALLETEPAPSDKYAYPGSSLEPTEDSRRLDKFKDQLNAEKKEKVLEGLYKALYFIIDDYDLPYNKILNRAIGKAIAMAIRGEVSNPDGDKDIKRLYELLKPVVTEAIDES